MSYSRETLFSTALQVTVDTKTSDMPLKGRWSITYGYSKDISFTPTISLYYAYPVTSTYVEDDVVIIQ